MSLFLSTERISSSTPYAMHPLLVFWEATRACDLACRHCRACAQPRPHLDELSTSEALALLEEIRDLQPKFLVVTGGDPLKRPDLLVLLSYATKTLGLKVALSPSATARFLRLGWRPLWEAGVTKASLSLDGPDQASHDRFRGVRGTWTRTMIAIEEAQDCGVSLQINTTLTRTLGQDFAAMRRTVERLRPSLWNLFALVKMGRATSDDLESLLPWEMEKLLNDLAVIRQDVAFDVKTTEAPQFRRVVHQHYMRHGGRKKPMTQGAGDGRGVVFVSHTGEIFPSGFLPVVCGNIRQEGLTQTYRNHSTFCALRDSQALGGKCGTCEFRVLCGGSRARAHATHGDYLAADPQCPYESLNSQEAHDA
ncbi:MAG: radical SAM protein [Verrucomicrobiales bacterium]